MRWEAYSRCNGSKQVDWEEPQEREAGRMERQQQQRRAEKRSSNRRRDLSSEGKKRRWQRMMGFEERRGQTEKEECEEKVYARKERELRR